MDRIIEYPMEQIVVDDFLNQRVADMIALGKLISALLGTQTAVEGLACTPTSPASMDVLVAPGQIFFLEAVDTTTYGDLSPTVNILGHNVAPNAAQIMKQGLILSETTFSLAAPSTAGDSVNYLISAAYEDQDSINTVLNYYNSSNPSQPFQGPSNSGTAQPILRQGKCVLLLTAGTAATTGTQQTPAVPSGQVGLYVITVAEGQTSITASNISVYSGAPFLTQKLFGLMNESAPITIAPATASDQAVNLGQFEQKSYYVANQASSITATTSYQLLCSVQVTMPSFSKTGAFRANFRMNIAFTSSVATQFNLSAYISDGVNQFNSMGNAPYNEANGNAMSVNDYFTSEAITYVPGAVVTFGLYASITNGGGTFDAGSLFQTIIEEA